MTSGKTWWPLLQRCVALVEHRQRRRALVVIGLAIVVSLIEAVSALLILFLLRLVTAPSEIESAPLVGSVLSRLDVSDRNLFLGLAAFLAVFFLFRAAAVLTLTYLQNRVAYNAGVALSGRLVRAYFAMPYAIHLRRNSAELIRNAYTAVGEVVAYAFVPIVGLVSEAMVVIAVLAVLLASAPLATLAAVALLGPVVLGLIRWVQPRLRRLGEQSQQSAVQSLQSLSQSLEGIRDITVLGRREYFHKEFVQARRLHARAQYTRAVLLDLPRLTVETAAVLFILAFLALREATQDGAVGSLAILGLFAYAVLRLMPALNRMVANVNTLRFAEAAVRDVHEDLLRLEHLTPLPLEVAAEPLGLRREIRLSDVSFRYDGADRDALDHVELTISRGESIGVVGATGGGKSTLVDVLLGLLEPASGSVLVDDVDVRTCLPAWHATLGIVPQQVFLLDDTLRRNVALGLDDDQIDDAAVLDALRLAQLEGIVASTPDGLDLRLGERGARLSGGQRQRVAIARALYHRPEVLVFDEGTSALDTVTEAELVAALVALKGKHTVLTVAHRLSTVRQCDRIVLMREGRVADVGSYDDLVERNGEFRSMTR
jgi:ABC-type multidrug transport system fused ATPase/permease subunit